MHFLALIGVSLNVRAYWKLTFDKRSFEVQWITSCRTEAFSRFLYGFPLVLDSSSFLSCFRNDESIAFTDHSFNKKSSPKKIRSKKTSDILSSKGTFVGIDSLDQSDYSMKNSNNFSFRFTNKVNRIVEKNNIFRKQIHLKQSKHTLVIVATINSID